MAQIIQTDERGRVVLSGRRNELFVMTEGPGGSIHLEPGHVVSDAQRAYDQNPRLREVLAEAAASPTVHRARSRPRG